MANNNTSYLSLAEKFFSKIKDYDLANMEESVAYEIAIGYIPSACLMFESCNQDLDDRDDELQEFNYQLSPNNQEMLVNYMVIEYLDSNYLRTSMALKSRLSSSDFHSLNLHNMLSKAMELRSMLKSENDQLKKNGQKNQEKITDIPKNKEIEGGPHEKSILYLSCSDSLPEHLRLSEIQPPCHTPLTV